LVQLVRIFDNLQDVIRSAAVSDQTSNARAEFQTQVDAAGLAQAAEGLLRLISELKVAAIVQDARATTGEAEQTRIALTLHSTTAEDELRQMRDDIGRLLTELETHYYQSQCGVLNIHEPPESFPMP
jgi:mediator of RNA polymerase II transcription subunit 22